MNFFVVAREKFQAMCSFFQLCSQKSRHYSNDDVFSVLFLYFLIFTWDRSMRRTRRRSYGVYDFGTTAHSQLIAYRNFSNFGCLHVYLQASATHTHSCKHPNETATNLPTSQPGDPTRMQLASCLHAHTYNNKTRANTKCNEMPRWRI